MLSQAAKSNFAHQKCPLWLYSHLNNPIQFVLEEVVSLLNILQLIAVGDQRGGVDFALLDEGEDFSAVAAVDAAGFEGQVFAVHFQQGQSLCFIKEYYLTTEE